MSQLSLLPGRAECAPWRINDGIGRSCFLRDEERAPIEYNARAHGYRLTEETYRLPPVRLSRKEAFSFALGAEASGRLRGHAP